MTGLLGVDISLRKQSEARRKFTIAGERPVLAW